MAAKQYWLLKSEPDAYSIDDLAREGRGCWDGVRNFQARNLMRDKMRIGDGVLFYHSNASPPGIAGLARVASAAYPDHTQFDPASPYHDPKATAEAPRWLMVDVEHVETFPALVPLDVLRRTPGLEDMMVLRRGMRLSVQPVTASEWRIAVRLGRRARPSGTQKPRRERARRSR